MRSLLSAKSSKKTALEKADMKLKAAQKEKRTIEAKLKQLESEIFTIKTKITKKNRTKKLFEIADDPLAHESAINFVKKMKENKNSSKIQEIRDLDSRIAVMTEEDPSMIHVEEEKAKRRELISAKLSHIEKRREQKKEKSRADAAAT